MTFYRIPNTLEETARNLATNPSFETASGTVEVRRNHVLNPWAVGSGGGVSPVTSWSGTSGAPLSGTVTGPDGQSVTRAGMSLSPTQAMWAVTGALTAAVYTASVWVRAVSAATLHIEALTNAGTLVAYGPDVVFAAGEWKRLDVQFTATATAHRVAVRAVAGTSDVLATWALCELGTVLGSPFSGAVQTAPDADLTAGWNGTANNSTCSLVGAAIVGVGTGGVLGRYFRSEQWCRSGSASVRVMPLYPTRGSVYIELASKGAPKGLEAGKTYTLLATFRQAVPQGFTASSVQRSAVFLAFGGPGASAQAPDVAGSADLRVTFTIATALTDWYLRLYNGGAAGDPDCWWDDVAIVEGVYDGPYFDGDTPDTAVVYSWTGTPHASTSITETPVAADTIDPTLSVLVPHTVTREPRTIVQQLADGETVAVSWVPPGPRTGTLQAMFADPAAAFAAHAWFSTNHDYYYVDHDAPYANMRFRVVGDALSVEEVADVEACMLRVPFVEVPALYLGAPG